jgi:hypothetical protein
VHGIGLQYISMAILLLPTRVYALRIVHWDFPAGKAVYTYIHVYKRAEYKGKILLSGFEKFHDSEGK